MTQAKTPRADRSFDAIADHFEKKVYGNLKGDIRLAVLRRDIFSAIDTKSHELGRPLKVLDVGAGLGQLALEIAAMGHDVVINDISANMIAKAKDSAKKLESTTTIRWYICPYQDLKAELVDEKFDVILCHALLEWLAKPWEVMNFFDERLNQGGLLSLCFYNPASFDYRNLIMGNFNLLDNQNYQADNKKSLTPNHPVAFSEVNYWFADRHYQIKTISGLRVFHDYAPLKRGGHNDPSAVIAMELRYSNQEPFKWLGRYLHILAQR